MSISSPMPHIAFRSESQDEQDWLESKAGLAESGARQAVVGSAFRIDLDEDAINALTDRPDGVALLAEALAHQHATGQFHELVSERIAELRSEKDALEDALASMGTEYQEAEDEELADQLARLPDLSKALREAPAAIQRQVFAAFDLQIAYDKVERRVELSATVSEAVADAFQNAEALLAEGSSVVVRDIAGAGFEPATSGL